jgi:hypothetical protein
MDLNHRYPAKFLAALSIPAQFTFRNITVSLAPGTDGSNPCPSSTESGANFNNSIGVGIYRGDPVCMTHRWREMDSNHRYPAKKQL